MNPENPHLSPEELEARLTALVLGELPADEAAALERTATADPALAQLLARLRLTASFVREAAQSVPSESSSAPSPRLSNDRREALLQKFKVVPVPAFVPPRRRGLPWFVPMTAAAGLVILFALLLTDSPGALLSEADPRNLFLSVASAKTKSQRERVQARNDAVYTWGFNPTQPSAGAAAGSSLATIPPAAAVPAPDEVVAESIAPVEANGIAVVADSVQAVQQTDSDFAARQDGSLGGVAAAKDENAVEKYAVTGTRMTNAQVPDSRMLMRYAMRPASPAGATRAADPARPTVQGTAAAEGEERLSLQGLGFATANSPAGLGGGGLGGGAKAGAAGFGENRAAEGLSRGAQVELDLGQKVEELVGRKDRGESASPEPVLVAPATAAVPFAVPTEGYAVRVPVQVAPAKAQAPAAVEQLRAPVQSTGGGVISVNTVGFVGSKSQPQFDLMANGSFTAALQDAKSPPGVVALPVLAEAPAKTPVLGDLPSLGRFFKEAGKADAMATAGRSAGAANLADFDTDGLNRHFGSTVEGRSEVARKGYAVQLMERDAKPESAGKPVARVIENAPLAAAETKLKVEAMAKKRVAESDPAAAPPQDKAAPVPQPEVETAQDAYSTFSLNVTDVSFKLAGASLDQGSLPSPASIRSEEFLNAFNYRDPEPVRGAPIALAWERAQYPFAHNRDAIRFSVQTAAKGRGSAQPLNVVLLLDNSGSMERADRVQIIREALAVLARQLKPQDRVSIVTFARNARLWADGLPGDQAAQAFARVAELTPEGGTNLEDALRLAYATARRHFLNPGLNRVVLLTDGAANLGEVNPESLQRQVVDHRRKGIALDCFGIGWEGYNDDLLEVLSSHGDGRYGFVNTPEEAATELAGQLAGALQVAANDVKVQVVFNPQRVPRWRQVGYARHQLTQQQFRDNTVDAAELGAAEAGNALYLLEVNPQGEGNLGTVYVRYREPGTDNYRELSWPLDYRGPAPALEQSSPSMRLAVTAGAFAEWLATSPFAADVQPDRLLANLRGVPEQFAPDARPQKLEAMIRQAQSIQGK